MGQSRRCVREGGILSYAPETTLLGPCGIATERRVVKLLSASSSRIIKAVLIEQNRPRESGIDHSLYDHCHSAPGTLPALIRLENCGPVADLILP